MKNKRSNQSQLFTREGNVIRITSKLTVDNTPDFLYQTDVLFRDNKSGDISIDLSEVKEIDSAGALAVHSLKKMADKYDISLSIQKASPDIQSKLDLFKPVESKTTKPHQKEPFLAKIGGIASHILVEYVTTFFYLVSDIVFWSFKDLFHSKQRRKGEFVNQAVSIGVNAVPIVMSMAFIIGLVLA
ncbi:STAS domain-containing protein, partial [Marinilabilia sp.]